MRTNRSSRTRWSFIEACSSCSGEEGTPLGHCTVLADTALVAAAAAVAHCNTARATQDMPVGHSHGQEAADAAVGAAGTDQGVLRHMEVAVVAHHRWGMAVSMEVLTLVGSKLALAHPQVEHRTRTEHEEHVAVVMDCADPVEQKSSSAC